MPRSLLDYIWHHYAKLSVGIVRHDLVYDIRLILVYEVYEEDGFGVCVSEHMLSLLSSHIVCKCTKETFRNIPTVFCVRVRVWVGV